jgi:hypothetical protein
MLKTRPCHFADASLLASRLRKADLQEIQALLGEDPLTVLERGIASSEPGYTIVDENGSPLALFGVVPDAERSSYGLIWLLGSRGLLSHSFSFLRQCRAWVELLQERYAVLWNCVDARNETHLRWLEWCGFQRVRRIDQHGVEQRPFYEFRRERAASRGDTMSFGQHLRALR